MADIKNTKYSDSDNEVLSTYLKAIDKIPLLTYEEEYELALKAKNGDKKARERLINSNLRFVVSVAKKFKGQGMPLEDLINEGNIGLMTAVDKFEPEKGYHFISYAVWWVRQAILKANSPSCGVGQIYDGTFSGKLTEGNGVFAGMLKRLGVEIITEKEKIKW